MKCDVVSQRHELYGFSGNFDEALDQPTETRHFYFDLVVSLSDRKEGGNYISPHDTGCQDTCNASKVFFSFLLYSNETKPYQAGSAERLRKSDGRVTLKSS